MAVKTVAQMQWKTHHYSTAETEVDGMLTYVHHNHLTDTYEIVVIVPRGNKSINVAGLSIFETNMLLRANDIDLLEKVAKKKALNVHK